MLERDENRCVRCGIGRIKPGYLEIHHILPYRAYPDKRYDVDNGMTLCVPCHGHLDVYRRMSGWVYVNRHVKNEVVV